MFQCASTTAMILVIFLFLRRPLSLSLSRLPSDAGMCFVCASSSRQPRQQRHHIHKHQGSGGLFESLLALIVGYVAAPPSPESC